MGFLDKVEQKNKEWYERSQAKQKAWKERTDEKHKLQMDMLREEREHNKAKYQEEMAAVKQKDEARKQERQSETEKLAKTGNFIIRGIALWYLIPLLAVGVCVFVLLGVWVLDLIGLM